MAKADIVRDQRPGAVPKKGSSAAVYSAEDIRIQQYGDTAIVAFRLIGTTEKAGATETNSYLNTGTLLKRGGKWQAVAWQSTKMPRPEKRLC